MDDAIKVAFDVAAFASIMVLVSDFFLTKLFFALF